AGGFSAGARQLGMPKAKVSQQVAALEAALGVRLLQRTTRIVRPTEAGRALFERAAALHTLVDEANQLAGAMQDGIVGRLRLSIPMSFGRAFLHAPLSAFLASHPRLDLELDVSDRSVDMWREEYDLAIRVGPVTQPDLVTRRLCQSRKRVVVAPSLWQTLGALDGPAALSTQPCLLYAHQHPKDTWLFRVQGEAYAVPVAGRIRSSDGDFLRTAAQQGLGFAWLPDFIVDDDIRAGQLVALFDDACDDVTDVHAVLPARQYVPTKVRALIAHLQQALSA
ncbi:MAG: LysR family transcriptional regulator, partial [Polyangiales bacterium]